MANYKSPPPAPPPPLWKRALAFAQSPLGATVIGGLVLALILAIIFGPPGSGSSSSSSLAGPRPRPDKPKPEDATQQVAQRAIWTSPPTTFPGASEGAEGTAATDPVRLDLLVGFPKEIFEEPEFFEGKTFFLVGRVASQQPVTGPFYDRELRLVTGERGFDAYVGASSYETSVVTGGVVTALGRLAATGETQPPGDGSPRRSIYLVGIREENGGEVEEQILTPSSGNLRRAIKRVEESTK